MTKLTVLVIGGYGTFGSRLCRLLADEPRLTLIVAGRSLEKAEAFCRRPSEATLIPAVFDRSADVAPLLAALRPGLVVDASGPFQAYGGDPYRIARAAIAVGADYLDLADGSDFVLGIDALDREARQAGRFVLSGASTVPALSGAVVRSLASNLSRIDGISVGISPSPHADLGESVVRAIATYAGKPVSMRKDGTAGCGTGIVTSRRHTIVVPGTVPLGPLRYSLVDVPDLAILPTAWPTLRDVFVGASPRPVILHRLLRFLARLVRAGFLPSLVPFAGAMTWSRRRLRWGEDRGGMFVEVAGLDIDGKPATRRWHMLAEGDDGPFVPSIGAEIIIRACLDGRGPAPGARPAGEAIEREDYERRFRRLGIRTAVLRTEHGPLMPIYRQLLGPAFEELAAPLRRAHDVQDRLVLRGTASVKRGRGLLARLIGAAVGFPPAGENVPVTVTMTRREGEETWERDFGGRRFGSRQSLGTGRSEGLIVERFGPLAFAMAVVVRDGRLSLIQRHWTLFGIPMPRPLLPTGSIHEHDADGRFNFHVEIVLPIVGPVVAYRGWLDPV